jgi:hypothetical protein
MRRKIGGFKVYRRGSLRKWSRLGFALAVVSIFLPEGPYQWFALSLGVVAIVIAGTHIPRQAWATHKVLVGSLGCVVVAMSAAEFLPLSAGVITWTVGVTGVVFIGVIVFSAVRLLRKIRTHAS